LFVLLLVLIVLLAGEVSVALIQADTNTFKSVNGTEGLNPQFVDVDHELETPAGQEGPIPSYALPQADKDPNMTGISTLSTQIFLFIINVPELSVSSPSTSSSPALTCSPFIHACPLKAVGVVRG
jgi:hypothetical protein